MGTGFDEKTALLVVNRKLKFEQISYRELRFKVNAAASRLGQAGVGVGHCVYLRIGNSMDFPIYFLALATLGAIPVVTSAKATVFELKKMAEKIVPDFVVVANGIDAQGLQGKHLNLSDLAANTKVAWNDVQLGDPNRLGFVMFTSGTGAEPKPVLHAHRAIWARRMMWADWYDLRPSDRVFHAGAFNWSYTLGAGLLDPWACGATTTIAEDIEMSEMPDVLKKSQATIFAAAPGVFRKLTQVPNFPDIPDLRHCLSAGDVLPEPIRACWVRKTGTNIYSAFGMTECSTFLSEQPNQSNGMKVQNGRRIAIVNNGNPCPVGEVGSIAIHKSDPGLMLGYASLENPQLPIKNGWFETSDLGKMSADGTIVFEGRSTDVMNSGGYRVSPNEVEQSLLHNKTVSAAIAVTEIEVKPSVKVIMAFVESNDDADIANLRLAAEAHLADYKRPRDYISVSALPRNANGKILRNKLQKIWESQNG